MPEQMSESMTLAQLEAWGCDQLRMAGLSAIHHDVKLLLMAAAGLDKAGLISASQKETRINIKSGEISFSVKTGFFKHHIDFLKYSQKKRFLIFTLDSAASPSSNSTTTVLLTLPGGRSGGGVGSRANACMQ